MAESYHWPSPRDFTDLHPVAGARIAPADTPAGKRGGELVFALRADQPGRYTVRGIRVDYHVGSTKHKTLLKAGLRVCVTPPGQPRSHACHPPSLE